MNRQGPTFPFLLEMSDLESLDFEDYLSRSRLTPDRIRIITGRKFSRRIGDQFARNIRSLPVEVIGSAENSLPFHEHVCRNSPLRQRETLVVGIGGGAVLDFAKYHASSLEQPYFAIPTVISNDGIASPIAILADQKGQAESYSATPPIGIVIDSGILLRAPSWALTNGLGDVLSNHSAVMDWDLAVHEGRAEPNALARIMSRTAVESVLAPACSRHNLRDRGFLERYINAIVLSGLAMYISGNSRPCSGAEHLIAHVISRSCKANFGHGFLVGSIAPYIVWLHDRSDRSLLPLANTVGFEFDFLRLPGVRQSFGALIDAARTIRGPRYTILDQLSNSQLEAEYRSYLRALKAPVKSPLGAIPGAAYQ